MPDPKAIYRLLLKLYPARFREEYETPLERQFWDEYREIEGGWPRALFWLRALADLSISIPAEFLRELRQDLRFAARVYRQRRVATGLALAALALAIGVTTGVFSVLNALLLRSLPFRDPERLVEVRNSPQGAPAGGAAFHAWRGSTPYLEDAAIYSSSSMSLSHGGAAVRVRVTEVSGNFFNVWEPNRSSAGPSPRARMPRGARRGPSSRMGFGSRCSAATRACWGPASC